MVTTLQAKLPPVPRWHPVLPGAAGARPARIAVAALQVLVVAPTLAFAASWILPFAPDLSRAGSALVINTVYLSATALVTLRAVLVPKQRLAWAMLAAALGCYTAATSYSWVVTHGASPLPFPSVADAGWLLLYPFAYTGIILLIRAQVRHSRTRMFLDGAIAGLGGAAIFSALVIGLLIKSSAGALLSTAVAVAYPTGDALLVGMLVCLFTITGWKHRGHLGVLTASMVAFAVADTGYLVLASRGAYEPGGAVDALYLMALMLVGLAAWRTERPTPGGAPEPSGSLLVAVPTAFALASLGLVMADNFLPVPPVATALAGATLLAIVVRTLSSFRELRQAQAELVDAARQAGMAEIATNVLHSVGNALNNVNVSATLVGQKVRGSKAPGLERAVALMNEHADDLGGFITTDIRGKELPRYLATLASALASERAGLEEDLARLNSGVAHIKQIVSAQQSLAGVAGVIEPVKINDVVDEALRMAGIPERKDITVVRDLPEGGAVPVDRHRVLLVVLNLISNAKHAMDEMPERSAVLSLQVQVAAGRTLRISVADNGVGIAPENLAQVFRHGFTTRAEGHGYGLHSSALAANEMGGTLGVRSDGPGTGATFTLEIPLDNHRVPR